MKSLLFSSFLILLFTSFVNNTYADSKVQNEKQLTNSQSVIVERQPDQFKPLCTTMFQIPCENGQVGGGWVGWVIRDCDTGEIKGSGWYDFGCSDGPIEPIVAT